MEDRLSQVKKRWNTTSDSAWYQSLRTDEKIAELLDHPECAFHPVVFSLINKYIPDLKGKRILVPSSGDNHAVFAFSQLGAKVTSADISERQLDNASVIAQKNNLDIDFICDDTMHLSKIESDKYDLVFTSNGVHSWIPDLNSMYTNIYRVLNTSGFSIMYDVHPFNRPFSGIAWESPKVLKSYHDTLPDYHWRIQDLINVNIAAQLSIVEMAELQAIDASFWYRFDELPQQNPETLKHINNWECNPMAALPAWLTIISQKKVALAH